MKITVRLACLSALLCVSGLGLGCVDATSLPTKPYEKGIELSTHVEDWRDEVIYQIIVDRFYDGDVNNNFNVDSRSMSRYHGGDWQGIIDQLDYLEALGVTTLWISPVVKNVEEDAGFASYHGYWTQDFLKHNPHFGDLATLRRLSDALHARGMKLILDIVTNHVGQVFFYDINMNGQPDEWLAGSGQANPGSGREELICRGEGVSRHCIVSDLSRVTEYDPDFRAEGIKSYTSMGLAGDAPIIFFDMPSINRVAPGPQNIDLNRNGIIDSDIERMGFANPDWYHRKGRIYSYDYQPNQTKPYIHRLTNPDGTPGDYIDPGQARLYYQNDQTLLGDFPGGLKDLATERSDVRQALIAVFTYWIDVTNADGFRIDTLKHVEYSFWEEFAPAIRAHAASRGKKNFFMFGEAFDGDDNLLAAYSQKDQVDSVFLFSQKYAIDQAFMCAPGNTALVCGGNAYGTSVLYGWDYTWNTGGRHAMYNGVPQPGGAVDSQGNGVAPRDLLVNFIDNHDVGRYLFFRNDARGVDSLKNALTFVLLQRGIPCIYYGTEQGFMGGNDPANREDMWDPSASIFARNPNFGYANYKPFNTDNPLFKHIRKVIDVRKAVPALRRGTMFGDIWHSNRTTGDDAGIFAFTRQYEGKSVVVVVNTHETDIKRTRGTIGDGMMTVPWAGSTLLIDILNDDSYSVTSNGGKVEVVVPPMTTRVLIPQEDRAGYRF
ncbi:MAG: alpha-amylase family glycosyl hydrolase [Proteobacteria bacterium]|nr:alpha-amylase family glycosyl hydrolase [Pseudomonadota bacterium]